MNNKPFFTGFLPEDGGHKVYYEQYGNKKGPAIVVLHGGPGSHSKPRHSAQFDLSQNHVILFDQRGCGKSTPQGETKNNTTQDLITDIERLRKQLDIKKWFVCGGSWGSTLALAYAEKHPSVVNGLMISAIFLGRTKDVEWSFTKAGGIERVFTDLWESRGEFLKKFGATPANASKVLLRKISTEKLEVIKEVVAGVMNWEGNLMSSQSDLSFTDPEDVSESDINEVKIFLHYESNDSFFRSNQLLNAIGNIKDIPTIIVHGRYDLLCSLDQMWELTKALPNSEYVILPSSNHKLTADGDVARKYAYKYFLQKYSAHK